MTSEPVFHRSDVSPIASWTSISTGWAASTAGSNSTANWVASFQGVVSSTLVRRHRHRRLTPPGPYQAGPAAEVILQRDGRKLNYFLDYCDRSDDFRTLTGFDPQPDIHNLYQRLQYSFRPEGKHLISWGPQMEVYHTFDHEGNYLNSGYIPSLKAEFVGQTFFTVLYAKEMELLRPKDFSAHQQSEIRPPYDGSSIRDQPLPSRFPCMLDYRFGSRMNYDSPDDRDSLPGGPHSVTATS